MFFGHVEKIREMFFLLFSKIILSYFKKKVKKFVCFFGTGPPATPLPEFLKNEFFSF